MDSIEILAREMALADINKRRATQKLPRGYRKHRAGPLRAIPDFYWRIFGPEWMAVAADFSDYSI